MKGFKYQYSLDNVPLTLTIFSAPKYCDTYQNKGAVALINVNCNIMQNSGIHTKSFKNSEHPFVLNNYMNVFELSLPVLSAAVGKIFTYILKKRRGMKTEN
jgi:serine/threonine-protein phosphatase 2B catalytic subunit